jgi:hypothetical protein
MLKRTCATCGAKYEAQRSTSKYCKSSCRVRASQTRAKLVLVPATPPPADAPGTASDSMPAASDPSPAAASDGVLAATMAELEEIGATKSSMGQLALRHAARLQYVADTASGTAALSRELRQVLDAARASSSGSRGDAFDDIAKRRRAKWEASSS